MKPDEPSQVASQRVADILAERILGGHLRPGERIKQDELATELNISRIPVRDALRILESRGLVSLKANAGARVTSLTAKDIDMSYQIREMLEPFLLADSIPNLTDRDIEEMREIQREMDTTLDVEDFLRLNRRFHWAAFRAHTVPILAQIVERMWDTTESYRRVYARLALQDDERMTIMRAERELLFGAIARREADLAPRILSLHIRRAHTLLLQNSKPGPSVFP